MSDSNITKLALANSLKGLLVKEAFSNISVKDIVDDCGLTRQAFYYHFKDKYDLLKLYFVIPQPLRYMAGISTEAIGQLYAKKNAPDVSRYEWFYIFYHTLPGWANTRLPGISIKLHCKCLNRFVIKSRQIQAQ